MSAYENKSFVRWVEMREEGLLPSKFSKLPVGLIASITAQLVVRQLRQRDPPRGASCMPLRWCLSDPRCIGRDFWGLTRIMVRHPSSVPPHTPSDQTRGSVLRHQALETGKPYLCTCEQKDKIKMANENMGPILIS